jgi:leader peptidase (prepilin peptidase)/N-methyltransferase
MEVILIIFLFALGACVGSFLNVVIWRLPRGQSIVFPGSHCPRCGRGIAWYDNIPLLSWIALRARCRHCKAPISPRYIVVEGVTALLVAGLFVWLYVARWRSGAGDIRETWPTFLAHAALFCGLLACSLVDIESWIIPLEVCWVVSLAGVVCAGASPPPAGFMPAVSPAAGAMALAAAVGLGVAMLLVHHGFIQRSFLDAEDRPLIDPAGRQAAKTTNGPKASKGKKARKDNNSAKPAAKPAKQQAPIRSVAFGREHGVSPRREILREVLFLAPAIILAVAAWLLVTKVGPVHRAWFELNDPARTAWAPHLTNALAALLGYFVGGLWIWAFRIFGTLGFGREAMGLGDVHILAAVGAVCGWVVPSITFFMAAFLALAWALTIFVARKQRELPYGPWLAAGALVTVLFYDYLLELLAPYVEVFRLLTGG